jgi:hypothetical protein
MPMPIMNTEMLDAIGMHPAVMGLIGLAAMIVMAGLLPVEEPSIATARTKALDLHDADDQESRLQ